jgi:hypothetical protein
VVCYCLHYYYKYFSPFVHAAALGWRDFFVLKGTQSIVNARYVDEVYKSEPLRVIFWLE